MVGGRGGQTPPPCVRPCSQGFKDIIKKLKTQRKILFIIPNKNLYYLWIYLIFINYKDNYQTNFCDTEKYCNTQFQLLFKNVSFFYVG